MKRVQLLRNGQSTNSKACRVEENYTLEQFLEISGNKLNIENVSRIYLENGSEIVDMEDVFDGDRLFLSQGENFIPINNEMSEDTIEVSNKRIANLEAGINKLLLAHNLINIGEAANFITANSVNPGSIVDPSKVDVEQTSDDSVRTTLLKRKKMDLPPVDGEFFTSEEYYAAKKKPAPTRSQFDVFCANAAETGRALAHKGSTMSAEELK